MNPQLKMVLAGVGAGLFSALVWAGFCYVTGFELGWIAWGVGLAVGLAVRLAQGDVGGWVPGILAVVIALLSILGGKYLSVRLIVSSEFAKIESSIDHTDPEFAQVQFAKTVVAEFESKKKKLSWPEKKRLMTVATSGPQMASEFPADVWQETDRRWKKLTVDEREQWLATAKRITEDQFANARAHTLANGFTDSFSPYDILWFLLAAATAFRAGSGVVDSSD